MGPFLLEKRLLDHLKSRYFNTDIHPVWINDDEYTATFPIFNLSKQMVGYQQYKPNEEKKTKNNPKDSKYFTYTPRSTICVWGLETWNFSNELYITEGIFDACRLTYFGKSAIALFSNDINKSAQKWLSIIKHQRPIIAICDGDNAGIRLAKYGHRHHIMPENTDLGDATDQYVRNLINAP